MATIRISAAIIVAALILQLPARAADLPPYLKKVESLIVANKYDQAISTARNIEKDYPRSALVKGLIATAYMYKGDNLSAQKEAEEALRIDSKNYESHWVLSNVYMALGKPELGTREYELSMKYHSFNHCKPCAKTTRKSKHP